MVDKIEKPIPWMVILLICATVFFGSQMILREVIADTDIRSVTVGNDPPSVGTVILNSGSDITLTENATATVQATTTVTDIDAYTDISSVIGKLFRSGVGTSCTANDNNCYSDSSCATSSCDGNSCTATCEYDVWFHADPTDAGTYSAEYWDAWIKVIDNDNASSSATSAGNIDMNTLRALDISTSTISYGTINPGDDTGTLNQTTTITDTGNVAIDIYLYGVDLENGGNSIAVGQQEHSLSSGINYGSGTNATSATNTVVEVILSKPTSQPSTSTDDIYWGLGIPSFQAAGAYSGTTTFEAKKNWADYDYSHRKLVTIDNIQVDGDLTNFPVLISVTDGDLTGCRGDGYDIKFYNSDNSTQLKHEREYWASTTGDLVAWIKMPSMSSSSDTSFYMYYEYSSESTDQQNATSVWDSNFVGIYHMNSVTDSANFSNDLTDNSTNDAAGKMGRSRDFTGSDSSYMSITDADFDLPQEFTISCWYKDDSATQQQYATLLNKEDSSGAAADRNWWVSFTATNEYTWFKASVGGDSSYIVIDVGQKFVEDGNWHYVVIKYSTSSGIAKIIQEGGVASSSVGSKTSNLQGQGDPFYIGRSVGTANRYWNGFIDEVRVSKTERGDAWISTSYNNQTSTAAFMDFGSEELQ